MPTNYVFFNVLGLNYLAAAVAFPLSRFYYSLLQAAYIHWNGLGPRVWGTPSRKAFSNWGKFASLAYSSAAMRCMESFCYSGMTVLSGILPNGATAVSAIGLAFNIYGTLFMAFLVLRWRWALESGTALERSAQGQLACLRSRRSA